MFGFFASQNKKMRDTARNWLEMADKVWNYRRDELTEMERRDLRSHTEMLRERVRTKADAAELKLHIEALEPVLARHGGKIYPKTSMIDNVEFFLVATLVILGIRAFIVQPFKIPTNSMWPSYYGMTADNLLVKGANPGLPERAFRLLSFGAIRSEALAGADGEVALRVFSNGSIAYTVVNGRKWLVIPTQYREYTLTVGTVDTKLRVPLEFNEFDDVLRTSLFGSTENFYKALTTAYNSKALSQVLVPAKEGSEEAYRAYYFKTGKQLRSGEPMLRFDILTGDQLFVDRVSYHFRAPRPGDGFVFRTGNIAGIGQDQYYIKRLVGVPGDKLEIRQPAIYRNGAPITGSDAFRKNAEREGLYKGYADSTTLERQGGDWPYLRKGVVLDVPVDSYFAMGDNSYNSRDSRGWGFVPAADVIGTPLLIYYPFTARWGWAK